MTAHPAFQRGVGYGDRFDAEIARHLDAGLTFHATAARIGIGAWFVGNRARVLGYAKPGKPYLQRKDGTDLARPIQRASVPSKSVASVILTGRRDESPSRLARALRQRLVVLDRDGLDPSHGVACLHLAGLTLPEIEGVTGYPASAVVAAVRRHCAPLGLAEARR